MQMNVETRAREASVYPPYFPPFSQDVYAVARAPTSGMSCLAEGIEKAVVWLSSLHASSFAAARLCVLLCLCVCICMSVCDGTPDFGTYVGRTGCVHRCVAVKRKGEVGKGGGSPPRSSPLFMKSTIHDSFLPTHSQGAPSIRNSQRGCSSSNEENNNNKKMKEEASRGKTRVDFTRREPSPPQHTRGSSPAPLSLRVENERKGRPTINK
jgi:hypothetical protein